VAAGFSNYQFTIVGDVLTSINEEEFTAGPLAGANDNRRTSKNAVTRSVEQMGRQSISMQNAEVVAERVLLEYEYRYPGGIDQPTQTSYRYELGGRQYSVSGICQPSGAYRLTSENGTSTR